MRKLLLAFISIIFAISFINCSYARSTLSGPMSNSSEKSSQSSPDNMRTNKQPVTIKSTETINYDTTSTVRVSSYKKHDYSKKSHLPPSDWNPQTASDKELAYFKYPPKPKDFKKLNAWKKTVTGGWYDAKAGKIPVHSHPCTPCEIVWNNQVYTVDSRCGPINGKGIGRDTDGRTVYEIPGIDISYGIILGFGTEDGHRATRIDYDTSDALASLFLDSSVIKDKLDNLNFPHTATKIKTNVICGNKSNDRKIPVELETKIEETEKLVYMVTLTETWNTEDYNYSCSTQPVGKHYWRFNVVPNSYSDLDSGGDTPPGCSISNKTSTQHDG